MKRARHYIKDKGSTVEIDQPNSISVYNKTMGGVDRMDQRTLLIIYDQHSLQEVVVATFPILC